MTWQGEVLHIFTAAQASAPMQELEEANLMEGAGIEGDRYAAGTGYYSSKPHINRQVTLIEIETLEALERDHEICLLPDETRRNLVTRDVPLNHLVGRKFRVGADVVLYGGRLNTPCQYLEDLLRKPVFKLLVNRSGLNCQIVRGGIVRKRDRIQPDV
jgi:MOSC domain-containing protein YiiM